LDLVEGVWIAD
jgi:hypothetical protein